LLSPNTMKEISIEITHECPLECVYCSSEASSPSPIRNEISTSHIVNVLKDAIKLKAQIFSISGGEPLQREVTLKTIMDSARNLNYEIFLYTCGIQCKDGKLIEIKGDLLNFLKTFTSDKFKIIFNLQGHCKSIVEKINNKPNSFSIIEKSIKNCVKNGIKCEIHFVPFRLNFKYIDEIIQYSKNLGIKQISFLRFVPQGRALKTPDLNLTEKQFFELQKKLDRSLNKKDISIRLGHPIDFLFTINPERKATSCPGSHEAPLIYPNGEVHLCPAWKNFKNIVAGNIKYESIIDIWQKSHYFQEFREFINHGYTKIKGPCSKCNFLDECKGKCTAQRMIAKFSKENEVKFPECLYVSPDPMCPLNNKFVKKKEE